MATKQLYWTDAHFCGLRSQTNVYGLSKITTHDGLTKLLAVSINGHFISVEYQKSFDNRLIPITREDIFFSTSSSPGLAETEIVSFDVICQNEIKSRTVLAISYLKLEASYEEKPPNAFMNVYFLPERESDVPYPNIMEAIASSQIQYLSLDFIPFKLMHQPIYHQEGHQEMCFLLSGSDSKIHVYRQAEEGNSFFEDQDAMEKFFPELGNISGCVTQMEFRQIDSSHRLTVIGVQSGLVTLSMVNVITKEIKETWTTEMDSPITSLQLFTQHTCTPCPEFLPTAKFDYSVDPVQPEPINLLVTSAIDPAVVFCDVINQGLSESHILPHSNTQDVVLCSCITDIDFDGENEVLIGTYGQVLLAYKFVNERPPSLLMTSTPFQSPMPVPVPLTETPTPPPTDEKSSYSSDQHDKSDHRRRHKSVAALWDNTDQLMKHDKHDRHRSDECFQLEGSLKDGQVARLVRSQENLATSSPRSVYFRTPDHQVSSELTLPLGAYADLTDYPGYKLTWTKRFSEPVMGITCDDVMGDGMLNLVVLTLKGVHILQPDMNEVAALVLERLKKICYPESEVAEGFSPLPTESLEDH